MEGGGVYYDEGHYRTFTVHTYAYASVKARNESIPEL